MQKNTLSILCVLLCTSVLAQSGIEFSLSRIHINRITGLSFTQQLGKHHVTVGATRLIPNPLDYDQNFVFKNQAYGKNFWKKTGLRVDYAYSFWAINPHVTLSVAYTLHYNHSQFKSLTYMPYLNSVVYGIKLYVREIVDSGPTHTLEHTIGLQLRAQIAKNLFIVTQAGGGMVSFYHVDNKFLGRLIPTHWWGQAADPSYILSMGIRYQFKK